MNDTDDLLKPELYINRELSLLEFNGRVLARARIETIPLLERLNYLCIASSNLDEFYEVRVAGVLQMATMDPTSVAADGLTPLDQLRVISEKSHQLVSEQYRILNKVLIPLLSEENIHFIRRRDWTEGQRNWLKQYFHEELLPILTPVGLDSAHPFPRILNKSLKSRR